MNASSIIATSAVPYGIAADPFHGKLYVSFPGTYTVGVYALKAPYKLITTIN